MARTVELCQMIAFKFKHHSLKYRPPLLNTYVRPRIVGAYKKK